MNLELIKILESYNINFTYEGSWGAYHIHDEFETVCKDDNELKEYIESNF